MSLEIGQLIDSKYRIARVIGEGGMGAVYEGENIRINRRVAIKVLHSAYTGNAEVMQRFEREAQAAGRIGNDHILEVIDLGSLGDGDHFIVMEYLDGEPLGERIKNRGRLLPFELTPLIRQVLTGLGAAHQAGIVHRDLKPDNIFILKEKAGKADFVKIIDFGISKFQPLSGDGMKMTRTGAVMGTPYYMSPEQASGSHEADQRSDLYSVGVIMFEAVTGRVPFDAATFNQLMFKIVLAEVPKAEEIVPDLDPAYSSIIAKAMARDVNHRFQTAKDFIQALDEWMARGAAVSVPPPADARAAGLIPAGTSAARLGRTPAGLEARTGGNWATSQPESEPAGIPKKSTKGLTLGLAFGGLLLLGGGVLAALNFASSSQAPSTSSAGQPAASAANATPAPPSVPTEPEAVSEPAPPVEPAADESPSPAESAKPQQVQLAQPIRRPARPAPKPVSKSPAKEPAGAPPAKPARPSVPDFGY